jgi:hypothetical protein
VRELVSRAGAGVRTAAGTGAFADSGQPDGSPLRGGPPIGWWAFVGVAVASFGGPLALAALSAPGLVGDAADSAGLAMVIAAVVFLIPLAIWFAYSRRVAGYGGLYAFVEAAAGRPVAVAQAAVWIFSYVLYLVYTTVQIVYEVLPTVLPGEHRYQTLLALAIPAAMVAVMVAGRTVALAVIGLIAAGQVALAGVLDGVTLTHISTPASSFAAGAGAHALTSASLQTSLLYICGSLPLFLGGELANPSRTIRRGVAGAYALTAVVVILAVAPLAGAPGLLRTDIPGMRVAQQFAPTGVAETIGIGVAVSIAGVMLCEYLAVTRLAHALTGASVRAAAVAIGVGVLAAAPISLINPMSFYNALVKPSLVALWLSQLIVFAVYPRFAGRQRRAPAPAWALSVAASGLAIYGLVMTFQLAGS